MVTEEAVTMSGMIFNPMTQSYGYMTYSLPHFIFLEGF